jgi:hypothetical protein
MSWAEHVGETGRLAAMRAGELVRAAVEVVLPPQVLDGGRGAAPVQTRGLTAEAWSKIAFIEAPVCDRPGVVCRTSLVQSAVFTGRALQGCSSVRGIVTRRGQDAQRVGDGRVKLKPCVARRAETRLPLSA